MKAVGRALAGLAGIAGLLSLAGAIFELRFIPVWNALGHAAVGWLLTYGWYRATLALDAPSAPPPPPALNVAAPVAPMRPGPPPPPPSDFPAGALVGAALWYVFDAFFMGQGILSMMAGFLAFAYIMLGGLGALLTGRLRSFRPRRAAITVAMAVAAVATVAGNGTLARHRAGLIIAACERFHADKGRYPDRLQELVPAYLPSVPRAKYAVGFSDFRYSPGRLEYTALPPFGRPYYLLAEKRWGFLD